MQERRKDDDAEEWPGRRERTSRFLCSEADAFSSECMERANECNYAVGAESYIYSTSKLWCIHYRATLKRH